MRNGENVYTKQDLAVMQSWPLERKIKVTQTRIIEWYEHYGGNVAVSFSGGLDSTVLLDLTRRIYPDVTAVFVSIMDFPEIISFVKSTPNADWIYPDMPFHKVIEKYGYPVISKDVAKIIYYARRGSPWAVNRLRGCNADGTPSKYDERYMKWARLVDAPFSISDKCCEVSKKRPIHRYCKGTGAAMIVGTLACESQRRNYAYLQTGCNAFRDREPKSTPIAFWLKADILAYLKLTGIPYASIYGEIVTDKKTKRLKTTGAERTGCVACMYGVHLDRSPNRFQRMEIENPKLHDYCINKLGCGAVLDYLGVPYRAAAQAERGGDTS